MPDVPSRNRKRATLSKEKTIVLPLAKQSNHFLCRGVFAPKGYIIWMKNSKKIRLG
jgi:hypothetical protein